MKRFFGLALAMFFALVAIALVGGDSGVVAGHGCHGGRKCHGGLLARVHAAKKERCHGGLLHRHRRCHGEAAAAECGDCGAAEGCSACAEGCGDAGGCAGGDCGGAGVISEGVPTEAAPAAPAAPEKKAT
ncbi:MAG: hypothetical protein DWI03_02030 [Planctomycetota bacterium]|nr:MAG: hypothetical protein DWI03_02030 [Planctomycetota bacterium]